MSNQKPNLQGKRNRYVWLLPLLPLTEKTGDVQSCAHDKIAPRPHPDHQIELAYIASPCRRSHVRRQEPNGAAVGVRRS